MLRRLVQRPLSVIYKTSSIAGPDPTEQNVAAPDQASLNLNKAARGVQGFFPLNEPEIGSAYTNTVRFVCSEPLVTDSLLGHFHPKHGAPSVIPATCDKKRHLQEQDMGGTDTSRYLLAPVF
jgi:hypothetical protein